MYATHDIQYRNGLDYNRQLYAFGKQQENKVRDYLEQTYRVKTKDATVHEDRDLDIDCWLGNTPISIKSQSKALETGNFNFELEMHNKQRDEWVPAWYHTGQAKYYVIVVGDRFYQVSKERLADYVEAHGWDRECELSPEIAATQSHKPHDNYRNGLLSIRTALKHNIARVI